MPDEFLLEHTEDMTELRDGRQNKSPAAAKHFALPGCTAPSQRGCLLWVFLGAKFLIYIYLFLKCYH